MTDPGGLPAELLERFEVLEVLARSEASLVAVARQRRLRREVVLKVYAASTATAEALERFRREARALARVAHPAVVRLLDYGELSDGTLYVATERVPGETLEQRLARGPLEPLDGARLARELLDGLAHLHEQGVIHRDVSAGNVLVTPEGEPRLIDLGIALLRELDQDPTRLSLTGSGVVLGTPAYLAPERILGEPGDERSDVYSAGALLYHCLTGQPPFVSPEPGRGPLDLLARHVNELPRPPSSLRPDLPRQLDHLVLRALEKRPAERWPSARDFASALDLALAHLPATTAPAATGQDPTLTAAWSADDLARAVPAGGGGRRSPRAGALLTLALLLVLGVWVSRTAPAPVPVPAPTTAPRPPSAAAAPAPAPPPAAPGLRRSPTVRAGRGWCEVALDVSPPAPLRVAVRLVDPKVTWAGEQVTNGSTAPRLLFGDMPHPSQPTAEVEVSVGDGERTLAQGRAPIGPRTVFPTTPWPDHRALHELYPPPVLLGDELVAVLQPGSVWAVDLAVALRLGTAPAASLAWRWQPDPAAGAAAPEGLAAGHGRVVLARGGTPASLVVLVPGTRRAACSAAAPGGLVSPDPKHAPPTELDLAAGEGVRALPVAGATVGAPLLRDDLCFLSLDKLGGGATVLAVRLPGGQVEARAEFPGGALTGPLPCGGALLLAVTGPAGGTTFHVLGLPGLSTLGTRAVPWRLRALPAVADDGAWLAAWDGASLHRVPLPGAAAAPASLQWSLPTPGLLDGPLLAGGWLWALRHELRRRTVLLEVGVGGLIRLAPNAPDQFRLDVPLPETYESLWKEDRGMLAGILGHHALALFVRTLYGVDLRTGQVSFVELLGGPRPRDHPLLAAHGLLIPTEDRSVLYVPVRPSARE